MKKLLLFFVCIISATLSALAIGPRGFYEVTYTSDIYTQPSEKFDVIGKVHKFDTIWVDTIYCKDWAIVKYQGQKGYMHPQELKGPISDSKSYSRNTSLFDRVNFNSFPKTESKVLFWIAAILAIIMAVISGGISTSDIDIYEGPSFLVCSIEFLLTSIAELAYFATIKGDDTWFVSPREVGWIWTLINFAIFSYVVYCQMCLLSFIVTASNIHGGRRASTSVGYWGMFGGLIVALICSVFKKDWLDTIFYLILISQGVQLVMMIVANVRYGGNYINLLYTMVLYVVGMAAFIVVLKAYLGVMLIVALGILLLSGVKVSDFTRESEDQSLNSKGWIMGNDGQIKGDWSDWGDGLFHSDDGHRYTSNGQKWD